MSNIFQVYLISDSTGETLDRIFFAIKAQFQNIEYEIHTCSFTRTENQIIKILSNAKKKGNSIVLYSIVDSQLAKFLANESNKKKNSLLWCFRGFDFEFLKIVKSKSFPSTKWTACFE